MPKPDSLSSTPPTEAPARSRRLVAASVILAGLLVAEGQPAPERRTELVAEAYALADLLLEVEQ